MRKHTWLIAGYVLAAFSLSVGNAQQNNLESRTVRSADLERTREIYRRDCLVCHGASGDGKTDILRDRDLKLPDWTDPKSLEGRADQQLFNVIRFGKGKMPAERVARATAWVWLRRGAGHAGTRASVLWRGQKASNTWR